MEYTLTIIFILLVILLFVIYKLWRSSLSKGKVRYTFVSPQGEKIITNWKTFNQEEYDTIISVHTHPEESQYIKTDNEGTETIISIPFILNGYIMLERK